MASHSTSLIPSKALPEQERIFARAFALLKQAVQERVFPGASLAVVYGAELVAWRGIGRFTYEPDSPPVTPTTVFDLASVTKAVATTAMAMILYERGLLSLDQAVIDTLPEFGLAKNEDGSPSPDARRRHVTVRMLLAHSSGLADYAKLFLRAATGSELVRLACTAPLAAPPMQRACYSDLGFIVLGELLARLAHEPLDRFCQREIFVPLGMNTACFCPPAEWKSEIPPTVDDREFRMRVIQGEVHDENASVMGGISGHAGLFGNAFDIALFGHCMLGRGSSSRSQQAAPAGVPQPIVSAETVRLFTTRQAEPAGTSRALGWDTPSAPSQSGKYFSASSFGHLGYTGTSLWCDPERQCAVVLLTNRTWPDCRTQEIKRVRPLVHDAVLEAIEQQSQ
jgi:CubicO group peptidase (beta-lactamase class C family)